ncbi:MAG TPA: TPM domain-containing protein [Candidatus Omnitrophota bacterium]|nr:TPM domain-containing protein [Candidatus Omnitrophota bacterium]HRY84928.1 TPM domain-containing protein [Candidatus Omnitrophota bacterium]
MLIKGRISFLKKAVRPFSFFALLLFSALSLLWALQVPPRPDGYVTDRAGLLSPSTKAELETTLRNFETKTSNQVVVAVFPSLEGDSLEDFSIRLAETWKVGQKGRDNGVIFLIFKNDRKIRIEVGYGLEGVFPDALAGQIISQVVAPHFRKGDYEAGITAGVDAIMKATQGEFKGMQGKDRFNEAGKLVALFMVLIFFHFWVSSRSSRIRRRPGGYYPLGGGFRSGGFRGGGFSGGGGGFGGGGASGGW